MDSYIVAILGVLILGFAAVIYLINKKLTELAAPRDDGTMMEWLKSMNTRMDSQTEQLLNAQRAIYAKLAESAKTVGEMSEIGKSMKDLQQFLASPKLRGGIGEQVLRELLSQSLPREAFNLQYTFRSGVKVDAAIKTGSGIIPIDSKFTMENFKKMMAADTEKEREEFRRSFVSDVKDRVNEISDKYILTDEGTVDFALMYVPSEAVYYEIVNSETDLMNYAYKRRVMPVSPSTFYAFLRSVMLSFEGQKIASEIKDIQSALRAVQSETEKFGGLLATLQTHVNNSYSMMNRVSAQFASLSSKVDNVRGISGGKDSKETKRLDIETES